MVKGWERLGRHTLESDAANLTVSSIPHRDHLRVLININGTSGNVPSLRFRFNGDSSGSEGSSGTYAHRNSNTGGNDDTGLYKTDINPTNQSGGAGTDLLLDIDIINIADQEKLCINHMVFQKTAGQGAGRPERTENIAKWVRTSGSGTGDSSAQITKIVVYDSDGNNWATGSSMSVFGENTIPATVYPNIINGTIFEETDTGTHYMWDGTDTWNEIT